jgi:hypothetical protein
MTRVWFSEVVCTGIRGSTGVVQPGSNTRLFEPGQDFAVEQP